ncbi:ABC transporter permease [Streptomycetaceae bacterium NBC_01309]
MRDYTGTGALLRLAFRLDRVRATAWIAGLALFTAASAASSKNTYGSASERESLAESVDGNPAMLALGGRAFDLGSIGGVTAFQLVATMATVIGLMSVLLVVRHTRAEEEAGRVDLVGSAVVGRKAWPTAALLAVAAVNAVVALLSALALMSAGLPAAGSFAYAVGCAATGVLFGAVAAAAAQLAANTRTATGIAATVLGLAYLLRAAGDAAAGAADDFLSWLTWVSPVGWAEMMRPYAGERWWVLLLFAAATATLVATTGVLLDRRDIGGGILRPKLGPAAAAPALRSPLALAWRLQRGSLLAWSLGFFVVGIAFGGVAEGMIGVAEDNPDVEEMLRDFGGSGAIVDVFLGVITSLIAVTAGAYAVQSALRLRSEETAHRAVPLLSAPVHRLRWAASHLTVAAVGSAVVLASAGLGIGLSHGLRSSDIGGEVPRALGAALAYLPAVWTLIGLSALLFGVLPNLTTAVWGVLAVVLVVHQFGDLLKLDQAVQNLSPFSHVPTLPAADFEAVPLLLLLVLAAVLTAGGLAGFRRRDVR